MVYLGPGAGALGGDVVVAGPPSEVASRSDSATGVALAAAMR